MMEMKIFGEVQDSCEQVTLYGLVQVEGVSREKI